MALRPRLPVWAATRRNIHPLTYPDHHPTFISFFHLLRSIASSLFNLCAETYALNKKLFGCCLQKQKGCISTVKILIASLGWRQTSAKPFSAIAWQYSCCQQEPPPQVRYWPHWWFNYCYWPWPIVAVGSNVKRNPTDLAYSPDIVFIHQPPPPMPSSDNDHLPGETGLTLPLPVLFLSLFLNYTSGLIKLGCISHSTQNRSFWSHSPSQSLGLIWKN